MRLQHARIILTGAASGIGAALLARLAAFPCAILAADRDAPRLSETLARLAASPARVTSFAGDMGKQEDVDALFAAAVERMGGVDLFIAAAGFAYYERLARPDWDHIETIFRVNAVSPIYTVEKMAELNRGRPHRTVIVASAMGRLAIPGYALYGSTKAALHRFAEAYRLEAPDPAALSLVYPIGTRTRFFANSNDRAPAPLPCRARRGRHPARHRARRPRHPPVGPLPPHPRRRPHPPLHPPHRTMDRRPPLPHLVKTVGATRGRPLNPNNRYALHGAYPRLIRLFVARFVVGRAPLTRLLTPAPP